MQAPAPATLGLLAFLPLLAWRVYARARRMTGRQRLSRPRAWATVAVFPALMAILAFAARANWQALAGLAAGLAAGLVLASYGLRHTRFEATEEGAFYTPNAHLGIGLSLLLVGRVLYRLVETYRGDPAAVSLALSPLTLLVVGLVAGYYVAYAIGLVRWRLPKVGEVRDHASQ